MNIHNIVIEQLIVRAEGFLVSDMGGDKVMMSVKDGKYFNLGQSGGRIWDLLAEPTTCNQIVEQLCSEYEIEKSICELQVSAFLEQLAEQGLILNSGE